MSAGWTAAMVRGRGLALRRLGVEGARQVAARPTLSAAIDELTTAGHGRRLRTDMDLVTAQRTISARTLWQLRILAGWGPPLGARPLRLLTAEFEIANIAEHLAAMQHGTPTEPFDLGSLALAWPKLAVAQSPSELRVALARSPWGDPESEELGVVRISLSLAWSRLVVDGAPSASRWAISAATLTLAKVFAAGRSARDLGPTARRDASRVLGPRWETATTLDEFAAHVPPAGTEILKGIDQPEELWRAETRRWESIERSAVTMAAQTPPAATCAIGVFGLLSADAWRTRAALGVAARGGGSLSEVLDAAA